MVEKRILESVIPYILLSQLRYCVEMFYSRSVKPTLFNTRTFFLNVKKKKKKTLATHDSSICPREKKIIFCY